MGKAPQEPQLSIKLSFIVLAEYSVNLVSCLTPQHLQVIPILQRVLLAMVLFVFLMLSFQLGIVLSTFLPILQSPSLPYQLHMTYPLYYLQEKAKIVCV